MPLVDLDDPEELRARWSALAAVAHATGFDRRWYADENGWYHQDETGSDLRMVRLEGGRAVLFGFHTQHTQTAEADLVAGAPDWIGQPEVKRRIAGGDLGFVYGSFNGTWARASYPGDPWQPLDDGFLPIGEWITSDEEAAREMIEWAAEWADYLGGLDELLPVGVRLIRTAATTGITPESLLELFDRLGIGPHSPQHPDLRAALSAITQFEPTSQPSTPAPPATGYGEQPAGGGYGEAPAAGRYGDTAGAASAQPVGGFAGPPAVPAASGYGEAPGTSGVPSAGGYAEQSAVRGAGEYGEAPAARGAGGYGEAPAVRGGQPAGGYGEAPAVQSGGGYAGEPAAGYAGEPPAAEASGYGSGSAGAPAGPSGVVAGRGGEYSAEQGAGGYAGDEDSEDEESVVVPPGISPFTGQPIGDDADLVVGGSEPFAPEPPFTPEPPFRPDSPFAPDPPYTPEPYAPEPDPDPPYQPEDAAARQDAYGVVAKKPRLFRRRKHDEPEPAAPPPSSHPGTPPAPQPPASTPYAAPAQPDASAPAMGRPLPSSEPPRVGGPVDDGEDFYASLFADAPAAATYVPDVIRDAPAEPDGWSPDDATSEFTAVTDDTAFTDDRAAVQPQASVSASDDTGVIDPIPAEDPEPFEALAQPEPTATPETAREYDRAAEFEAARDFERAAEFEAATEFERAAGFGAAGGPESAAELEAAGDFESAREFDAARELGAAAELKEATEFEATAEVEAVAEPESTPQAPLARVEREWIGGAWINGVWVEDVAAYLAAQNAAGPAAAAPAEAPPVEAPTPAQPDDEPPTEERFLDLTEYDQSAEEEPPTEERVLDLAEFEQSAEAPAPGERVGGVAEFGESAEEPPTEEHVLNLAEFEQSAQTPGPEERVLGHAEFGQSADEPPTEERVLGLGEFDGAAGEPAAGEWAGEEPVGESPASEQVVAVPVEEPAVEEQLVADQRPFAEMPAVEQYADAAEREPQLEDEAPTAEIAAVTDQDPEDEYYASTSSPFVTEARDLPPNGFSSLEPIDNVDYRFGDETFHDDNFHDELLGDADWTADQLGEPQGAQVVDQRQIPHAAPPAEQAAEAEVEVEAPEWPEKLVEPGELLVEPDEKLVAPDEKLVAPDEKLVVPDAGGGAVAIPGLGVVGGDGPRVEPPPGSIEEAMRAEVERPRPRPKESAALKALREWCRARTKIVPSGFTIQVQVLDPSAPSYRFDLEPPEVDDPQYGPEMLTELLGELWIAESQGEQGGWLFARIDAAGRTLRIDRWYDRVPDWWDNPIEARLDVHGLVRRLNGRGPDWQPTYLEKLYTSAR